ncbi:hypothetical protein GGQ91_002547 [Methylobacterium fujisawaense]|uniref:Uncharacterized protein n=1 Tax=Methylobacterium fujisawaense TaxID=107400 RepID=A0ABR6DCU8_9HYPH|nr:hypothetical protein [Methylobacterium fujisawaense]
MDIFNLISISLVTLLGLAAVATSVAVCLQSWRKWKHSR